MKLNKFVFAVAMVSIVGVAWARSVTSVEARQAARAWVNRGGNYNRMGVEFGNGRAENAVIHSTTNDATFYTVRMKGGGTVFVSSDTSLEPVLGFTSETNDFSTIDKESPLWALLNCDVSLMKPGRSASKLSISSFGTSSSSGNSMGNSAKWDALIAEGAELENPRRLSTSAAAIKYVSAIDDLRVPKLLKSKWGQSTVYMKTGLYTRTRVACYNYYTPNSVHTNDFEYGMVSNAVCGCVATAMSQVMRYFEYPTADVPSITHTCSFNGTNIVLSTQGGIYNWGKMTLDPGEDDMFTWENCRAIGKLTSDAGISVWMSYSSAGSGAFTPEAGTMLVDAFGYKNVVCYNDYTSEYYTGNKSFIDAGGATRAETLQRTMFANFDAGLPVLVSIPGHAVVADGYGYSADGVDYVHFNMGWSGSCDFWYNIPNLTDAGVSYDSIHSISYNIFTNASSSCAVMSGRVVDDDKNPIADATVTVFSSSDGSEVAKVHSNERGIWSVILDAGTYDVEVQKDKLVANLTGVALTLPECEEQKYVNCNVNFTTATDPSGLGNSWGNDVVLMEPTVRVGAEFYSTLDKALTAATNDNDQVEILLPTLLKKSVSVSANCTLFATNADAWSSVIACTNNSLITVPNGKTLTVSNVVFDVDSSYKSIAVAEGGVLKVGGVCLLATIETAAGDNLVVGSKLDAKTFFRIKCKGADKVGTTFASANIDLASAQGCANQLLHATDTRLVGEAYENGGKVYFRWTKGHPSDAAAAAQTIVDGVKLNYVAIDDAIEDLESVIKPVEIVILKDDVFSAKYTLKSSSVMIRGAGVETPMLTTKSTAGFVVGSGTTLAFRDITFAGVDPGSNPGEICFIKVDGGVFTLDGGATLDGIIGCVTEQSGVIDLMNGTVITKPGSLIANCEARGQGGYGGAIYVYCDSGCTLNLTGGTITGCWAAKYGGGVYVDEWYGASGTVNISGKLVISDNYAGDPYSHVDDLCINTIRALPYLKVVGEIADGSAIGILYSTALFGEEMSGNTEGNSFITDAIGSAASETTLRSFFGDALGDGFVAAVGTGDKAGTLVWAQDPRDARQCDKSQASARLISGGVTSYWWEVSDALNEATNGSIVEVLKDTILSSNVTVHGANVILRSDFNTPAVTNKLFRGQDVQITIGANKELLITDLQVCGTEIWGGTEFVTNSTTFLYVNGGTLRISHTVIQDVYGVGDRNANVITVYNDGVFELTDSIITRSYNDSVDPSGATEKFANAGAGGAVLVDHAAAYLMSGEISNCRATHGGGVFACNGSALYVGGDILVFNNKNLHGDDNNIELSQDSSQLLSAPLTGLVYMTPGYLAFDSNLVAKVSYDWVGSLASLTNSAVKFHSDITNDVGVAVTNGTKALIVWSGSLKDGIYAYSEDDAVVHYALAGVMPTLEEKEEKKEELIVHTPTPFAIKSLDVSAASLSLTLTNLVKGARYSLFATNSLNGGFLLNGVEPFTNFNAEADGPITLELPVNPALQFWRAEAETVIEKVVK